MSLYHSFHSSEKIHVATRKMSKSGFFWNDEKSRFSLIVKQRFKNTSSRPIMTEEVSKKMNEVYRVSKRRKFIVLIKETNDIDEISNFFMYNYWNKIENFVKLMSKVSMRWKNWSDFRVPHSTQLRGGKLVEDRDTILELTGKIQELQTEINCMNDSRDFQECWISAQWTIPRYQSTTVFLTFFSRPLAEC